MAPKLSVNKILRAFSKKNNRRLVQFAFETEAGSEVAIEGCIKLGDAYRMIPIFKTIVGLNNNAELADRDESEHRLNAVFDALRATRCEKKRRGIVCEAIYAGNSINEIREMLDYLECCGQ